MTCPNCNKIAEDNATVCPQCGLSLHVAQKIPVDTPSSSAGSSFASVIKSTTRSDAELWHRVKRARIKGDWEEFDKLCAELQSSTPNNAARQQLEDFARVSHSDEILTDPITHSETELQLLENTLDLVFEAQVLTQTDRSPRLELIDQPEDPASEFTPTEEDLVLFRRFETSKPATLQLAIPFSREKFEALGSELFLRDTETSSVLDNIVRFSESGSRILLTGYGSFGGTAIVNRAVQRAREELQKTKTRNKDVEGLILVARVQVRVHSVFNDLESLLQQMIQEFYFETTNRKAFGEPVHAIVTNLKEDGELLGGKETNVEVKMGYSPTVGAELGAKPKLSAGFNSTSKGSITREKSPNAAYRRILEKLEQLGGIPNKQREQGILKSIWGLKYPSRVVLVFDGITSLETFLALEEVLFTHGVSSVVIVDQNNCDKWETRSEWEQLQSRFDHMYVPCIWNISELICAQIVDPNYEAGLSVVEKDFYRDFKKHLEFMSRGMPGESRKRVASAAKGSPGDSIHAGGKPESVAKIRQDARFYDLIANNWEDILGQSTVELTEEQKTDIARHLIYHMLDWIRKQEDGFSLTDGFKKFLESRSVSEGNVSAARNIFKNLTRLMVEQYFLIYSGGMFRLGPFFYPVAHKPSSNWTYYI